MKKTLIVLLVSSISFLAGLVANYSGKAQVTKSMNQTDWLRPTSTPTPRPQADKFQKLIDDRYVTKFNGTRLKLDYNSGVQSVDIPFAVDAAEVTPLDDGGVLAMFGDTLY